MHGSAVLDYCMIYEVSWVHATTETDIMQSSRTNTINACCKVYKSIVLLMAVHNIHSRSLEHITHGF